MHIYVFLPPSLVPAFDRSYSKQFAGEKDHTKQASFLTLGADRLKRPIIMSKIILKYIVGGKIHTKQVQRKKMMEGSRHRLQLKFRRNGR